MNNWFWYKNLGVQLGHGGRLILRYSTTALDDCLIISSDKYSTHLLQLDDELRFWFLDLIVFVKETVCIYLFNRYMQINVKGLLISAWQKYVTSVRFRLNSGIVFSKLMWKYTFTHEKNVGQQTAVYSMNKLMSFR